MTIASRPTSALRQIGLNIAAARKRRNLTQEDLAERCERHSVYIGYIERGERNVALPTLLRLAAVLGVAPAEFFAGIEPSALADYLPRRRQRGSSG